MDAKEQKSKEYADYLHKNVEEFFGRKCDPKDAYYKNGDIIMAVEFGWDEALKNILVDASKELPEYDDTVWVINENNEQFFCHRSNEGIVKTDKHGWCNYSGCDIVAWIRNSTFEEIISMNKDVFGTVKR